MELAVPEVRKVVSVPVPKVGFQIYRVGFKSLKCDLIMDNTTQLNFQNSTFKYLTLNCDLQGYMSTFILLCLLKKG